MGQSTNIYEAPITLGFVPDVGDLIEGTVNGVEVNGECTRARGHAVLYRKDNKNVMICEIVFEGGQAFVDVEQESAPTNDYELHLYRYTPKGIVKIPQEYVEGLEETTANTNQALEKATAAQSTADTAKSTAETAKSTAETAKSTAETRLMVHGKSTETTVTIDSLGSSGSATNIKNLGALNIENGSRISLTASDIYRDENIWNGYSRSFTLNMNGIVGNKQVVLTLLPDGNVQIVNHSGVNLTNVTITYHKIEVQNTYYNMTSGVWLPPYLCCSCIYLVSSKHTNNGYPVYKITVDDTGTLKATEVT